MLKSQGAENWPRGRPRVWELGARFRKTVKKDAHFNRYNFELFFGGALSKHPRTSVMMNYSCEPPPC